VLSGWESPGSPVCLVPALILDLSLCVTSVYLDDITLQAERYLGVIAQKVLSAFGELAILT
jgi:hypothetical protein